MKSTSSKVARRYARALLSLCDERGDGEQVRGALERLVALLDAAPEAMPFLANPTVAEEARRRLLKTVAEQASVEGTARNLVELLLDKSRIGELERIAVEFTALLDARSGRAQAEVVSAVPLSPPAQERLRGLLQQMLNKDVILRTSVDAGLLGGMVVRVGNTVYDASVRNHLDRLRHAMVTE